MHSRTKARQERSVFFQKKSQSLASAAILKLVPVPATFHCLSRDDTYSKNKNKKNPAGAFPILSVPKNLFAANFTEKVSRLCGLLFLIAV
jgi:hypothetical protein